MAKITLQEALDKVEMTYQELNEIAKDITADFFEPVNNLVRELGQINDLSNDEVRNYMIKLALASYSLSEVKEKALLKAQLSEVLKKEAIARNYVEAEGTASAKENAAQLNSSAEAVSEALFDLVSNLFKGKQDQCNRLVDALKSILMSRNMEAKLTTNNVDM